MAYNLVANRYDTINRMYVEDKVVSEETLLALEDVDRITCRYSEEEILDRLKEDGKITTQNHLVITRVVKDKTYRKTAMFSNPEMVQVIDSLKVKTGYENGRPINYKALDRNSEFFKKAFEEFKKLLALNPDFFIIMNLENTELERKTENYYSEKNKEHYHEEEARHVKELEEEMTDEFSRYKTFRKYIINMQKYKRYLKLEEDKIVYSSSNENPFETYDESEIDDDKEEFITNDEIEKYSPDGTFPIYGPKPMPIGDAYGNENGDKPKQR